MKYPKNDNINYRKAKTIATSSIASSNLDETNKKLMEMMKNSKAKIMVIGAGGAGNNTITRLAEMGIDGSKTISINTDSQDLFYSKCNERIQIGKKICDGLGTGGLPDMGEKSAEESAEKIKEKIDGADMVFVTCGLGGGTGTGSIPVISRIAKKYGALTIAVVTMPFSAEGSRRRENAEKGLEKLQKEADAVIVIHNDRLLELARSLPINKAFLVSDELLAGAVNAITELITKPGLVSLDFADIKSIMKDSGMAVIGIGQSDSGDRAIESVHKALNSPLLDVDISNAKSALINITSGSDLTLKEAKKIVQIVSDEIDPEANIIWGTQIQDDLANSIRTSIIVAGVNSQSILVSSEGYSIKPQDEGSKMADTKLDGFIDEVF